MRSAWPVRRRHSAAVPTAAAYFLPRALKRFTARNPDVRLRILDDGVAGRVDLIQLLLCLIRQRLGSGVLGELLGHGRQRFNRLFRLLGNQEIVGGLELALPECVFVERDAGADLGGSLLHHVDQFLVRRGTGLALDFGFCLQLSDSYEDSALPDCLFTIANFMLKLFR